MPPIERVLEGRQFFAIGFSGAGSMRVVHIIVGTHFQEYNMYSRAIRQQPNAPGRKGARGQAVFRSWIYWGRALWA